MSPKERVLKAIRHEKTDRMPIFATLTPQVAQKLAREFGISKSLPLDSPLSSARISHNEILTRLGNDAVGIGACAPKDSPTQVKNDGSLVDEWGIKYKKVGLYNEIVEHPLSEVETVGDLDKYKFPDPFAKGRFDCAKETVSKYSDNYAIVGDLECTMFELSWYLVGLNKFLIDLSLNREYTFELLDRVMEINIKIGKQLIELGADIIWTGDDFGTQKGMMISPELWRRVFKPRFKKVFTELKKFNPDIKIAYHSCGSIVPIIPDLIEIGLDILNPIQPRAAGMDPRILKERYGNELTFFGGIDEQQVLPFGTPEDVKREVRQKIAILGKGGGYIVAPAHNIQPDTPVENIYAIYKAVRE